MEDSFIYTDNILTIVRTLHTDASGPLSYNLTVTATNPDGTVSVPVVATVAPPGRTARYPVPSNLLSLTDQSTRQEGLWFADLFPPQSFGMHGQYAGLDNVRSFTSLQP